MPINGRPVGEHRHISPRHATNHDVAISRANEHTSRKQKIAGARFLNFQGAAFVEALRKHFRKTFGHMLHNNNRGLKIRGNLRQNKLQCVWTAGGNTNRDDAARRQRGASSFFRRGFFLEDRGRKLAAHGALGHFYFCNQLVGNLFEVTGSGVFWLGEEIDGAKRQGFERGVTALFRMGAKENHRQGSAPHNKTQRLHAVHARHVEIKRHDIRLQLFNFFQSECAVHGGANNFDGRFARENRGDQFPHKSGIINNEDSDAFTHAMAPRGVERTRRERTAGTFKIRTTVPSPSMEAPLTKSLETISPGRALITNSSSPTRLSTRRPKRFSAAPMTMTKCFFRTGCVSMLRKRLRWSRRTRVRIWSRRRSTSRWSMR